MPTAKSLHSKVKSERALFLNDFHIPYHDPISVDLVIDFCKWFKPNIVFLIGDFLDFYAISHFDRDPQRLLGLQEEINEGKKILKRICNAIDSETTIEFLEGNHEHRLIRYLWRHPEISSLESLHLKELLDLDNLNISHHAYHEHLEWHGLHIEHGNKVRTHSGATAMAMLTARGVSGISGHSHRLGTFYRTDNRGIQAWFENGCLCDLSPEYIIGLPNWQQGFSVGFGLEEDNRFNITPIPIIKHRIFYEGMIWKV